MLTLEERLSVAQGKIARIQRRMKINTWVTAIIGGLALVALSVYFTYGYFSIKELLDPKMLVNMVGQRIEDELPETRKQIETRIIESAPEMAEQLSERVVSLAPTARKSADDGKK